MLTHQEYFRKRNPRNRITNRKDNKSKHVARITSEQTVLYFMAIKDR